MAGEDASRDADLIAAILHTRSERAFRALYRRHAPSLFAFARRMVTVAAEADEVCQETWIRAIESLATFRGESAFRTWLFGIAVNCQRNARRRDARRASLIESGRDPDDHDATPLYAGASEANETGGRLHDRIDIEQAIRRLPEGYRRVFVLHDVHGFRHEDIASMLATTTGTTKSQLHHARRALRRLLRPDETE